MQFGIIGSGSWATALAKILTDNNHGIFWWVRNEATIAHIKQRGHNPHYLQSAYFSPRLLSMSTQVAEVVAASDVLIVAVPSAYVQSTFAELPRHAFENKKIISAVKGILPQSNLLVDQYLGRHFTFDPNNYFTLLGPCHAEEVAAEKLSFLTISGLDKAVCDQLAMQFNNSYLRTVTNQDVCGVQYAAVLKNIYALGAGLAHGLEYGDNFLSVYIANCAREMIHFLDKMAAMQQLSCTGAVTYQSSVYLGDLLVTCYSLYSRNRMFGTMIGKGYPVKAAQLELNMVAEGYNASKCVYDTNQALQAHIPIIDAVYRILWKNQPAAEAFKQLENTLI